MVCLFFLLIYFFKLPWHDQPVTGCCILLDVEYSSPVPLKNLPDAQADGSRWHRSGAEDPLSVFIAR